jgi:response regulator RpfG family c-di-GMP phosphodiesterase
MAAPAFAPPLPVTGRKPRILCVDDEPMVLEALRDVLRRSFDVDVAAGGAEGLALLKRNPRGYAIVLSDMRMPEMSGSVFLREARRVAPLAVRMLLTGYADTDAAIKAVNDGRIFRFLTKPCDRDELNRACVGALPQHRVLVAERDLLEQTLHGAVKALTDVLALASPAVFGQSARLKELVGGLARKTAFEDAWEVEVAALLAHLGAVTLPEETAEKLQNGTPLEPLEAAMVARVPEITQRILANIPRLDGVQQIVAAHHRRFDSSERGGVIPIGARMLRIALDFLRLEGEDAEPFLALETMRGRTGVYDPELLEAFAHTVGIRAHTINVSEVPLLGLEVGMRLAHEVRARPGHMLIARGHPVTRELIERLQNFPPGFVREPLRVIEAA